jgi:3-hydroxyacyl-[acyl-carrier-protein] dehydratase
MLREEILQCLTGSTRTEDGAAVSRYRFPATLTCFQGHFPGAPVLPGVCTIQAAILTAESERGQRLRLASIRSAKFHAFVSPGEELEFTCRFLPGAPDALLLKASVLCSGRKIAELSLQVEPAGEQP